MGIRPTELKLRLAPQRRFEAIDVNTRIAQEAGDILGRHRRALYCSFHTTAGYLDQSLSARMRHSQDRLSQFFRTFHALFPQGGEYRHDQMEFRTELTEAQKVVEPRNGDSHLTYIGAGLRNCVTYRTRPAAPVYFIELDGMTEAMRRERTTTVLAYDEERVIERTSVRIPVSKHPVDSVNLADPRLGLLDQINAGRTWSPTSKPSTPPIPIGRRRTTSIRRSIRRASASWISKLGGVALSC